MDVVLSQNSSSIHDVSLAPFSQEFTFLIDGHRYACFVHEVISVSPILYSMRQNDPLFNCYDFKEILDPHRYFSLFMDLIKGKSIDITFENAFLLGEVGDRLDIHPLSSKANQYRNMPISNENVFRFLAIAGIHNIPHQAAIQYFCYNWKAMHTCPQVLALSPTALDIILSADSFDPPDESQFFNWLKYIVTQNGPKFNVLLKYCMFTELDRNQMINFVELISYDQIPPAVWRELEDRLKCDVVYEDEDEESPIPEDILANQQNYSMQSYSQPFAQVQPSSYNNFYQSKQRPRRPINPTTDLKVVFGDPPKKLSNAVESREFQFNPNQQFNGVIASLQYDYPANWFDFLKLGCGGSKQRKIYNIFEYQNEKAATYTYWDNFDKTERRCLKENAYIIIEFKVHTLRLTHYTLASSADVKNSHQPKNWKIEGSNDGTGYTELHSVTNSLVMNEPFACHSFKIQSLPPPYRFFKLTMLENFSSKRANKYEMSLCGFELFGIFTRL